MQTVGRRTLGLVACFVLVAAGCRDSLYEDLDERSANEIVAELHRRGVDARKVSSGRARFGVEVPASLVGVSVDALEAAGLPRAPTRAATDVLGADALIKSGVVEHALVQEARAEELRRALRLLPDVDDASVRLGVPRGGHDASAAVVVTTHEEGSVSDREIARIVAAAVPEVDEQRVVVSIARHKQVESLAAVASVGPFVVPRGEQLRTTQILVAVVGGSLLLGFGLVAASRRR